MRLVDLYLNSTPTIDECFADPRLTHPEDLKLQRLLKELSASGFTPIPNDQMASHPVIEALLAIRDERLRAMFAFALIQSSHMVGHRFHSALLRGFLRHLKPGNLPLVFETLLHFALSEGEDPYYIHRACERCYHEMPRTLPRFASVAMNFLQCLAFDGRLQWFERQWPSIGPALLGLDETFVRQGLAQCRLMNAVECGRLQEALECLRSPDLRDVTSPSIRRWVFFYQCRLSAFMDPKTRIALPDNAPRFTRHHLNLTSCMQHLLCGRPDQAAALLTDVGPGIYETSLRVATVLALGDSRKARHIVTHMTLPKGDYLKRVLKARALHLAGDTSGADKEYEEALTLACDMKGLHGALLWARMCGLEGEGHAGRILDRVETHSTPADPGQRLWEIGSGTQARTWTALLFGLPERTKEIRAIGKSPAVQEVTRRVEAYSKMGDGILIEGESGTGKTHVARIIHDRSGGGRFLAVSCAGFSEDLMFSELFGHTRGSFTGAVTERKGLFEEAESGTVLLDEVQDMPSRLQSALLQVLESRVIRPIGSSKPRPIRCRIIAATSVPLTLLAKEGRFREDLRHRLEKFVVTLPPLRERRGDIPLLVTHFLGELGLGEARVPAPQMKAWEEMTWKGNIRELRNAVEQWAAFSTSTETQAPPPPAPAPAGGAAAFLAGAEARLYSGKPGMAVRRELLLSFLREKGPLAPKDLSRAMGVSVQTTLTDLTSLALKGAVRKREHSHLYEALNP